MIRHEYEVHSRYPLTSVKLARYNFPDGAICVFSDATPLGARPRSHAAASCVLAERCLRASRALEMVRNVIALDRLWRKSELRAGQMLKRREDSVISETNK